MQQKQKKKKSDHARRRDGGTHTQDKYQNADTIVKIMIMHQKALDLFRPEPTSWYERRDRSCLSEGIRASQFRLDLLWLRSGTRAWGWLAGRESKS